MRLDKFLKVSRVIKRRTVSKELALLNKVRVNGNYAKPAYTLKVGDIITLELGEKSFSVKVLDLREHALKNDASSMYEVISEE